MKAAKSDGADTKTETDRSVALRNAPEVVAPCLFVVVECSRPEAGGARHSLVNVDRVILGRGPRRTAERSIVAGARVLTIAIPDSHISSRHSALVRSASTFAIEDLGSRNGTYVAGHAVTSPGLLVDGDLIEIGHTVLRYRAEARSQVDEPIDFDSASSGAADKPLVTLDPHLAGRTRALARMAPSALPVLLLGETGTGKEVISRTIHRLSGRKGAFVAVNCGALPAALLEAQLFGHVRGAFSGAVSDAIGFLRAADGGTLLLDEVGDLPLASQAALLRALQEREVVPVGGVQPIRTSFRLIAATHLPLESLVRKGAFRQDLLARLAGFTFTIPPLRERLEDIGLLMAAWLAERSLRLTRDAARALLLHDWPLNVRELRQVVEVAATLTDGRPVEPSDLPASIAQRVLTKAETKTAPGDLRARLVEALVRHDGNVSATARELGKGRMQVHRWMRRFHIDTTLYRRS